MVEPFTPMRAKKRFACQPDLLSLKPYVKIGNHPIETTVYKWLFGVPAPNERCNFGLIFLDLWYHLADRSSTATDAVPRPVMIFGAINDHRKWPNGNDMIILTYHFPRIWWRVDGSSKEIFWVFVESPEFKEVKVTLELFAIRQGQ